MRRAASHLERRFTVDVHQQRISSIGKKESNYTEMPLTGRHVKWSNSIGSIDVGIASGFE
jgi:hypothetical protein